VVVRGEITHNLGAWLMGGDPMALSLLLKYSGPRIKKRLRIPPRWQADISAGDVLAVTYWEAFLHKRNDEPILEGIRSVASSSRPKKLG
jgi:hypothetical protein